MDGAVVDRADVALLLEVGVVGHEALVLVRLEVVQVNVFQLQGAREEERVLRVRVGRWRAVDHREPLQLALLGDVEDHRFVFNDQLGRIGRYVVAELVTIQLFGRHSTNKIIIIFVSYITSIKTGYFIIYSYQNFDLFLLTLHVYVLYMKI